MRAFAVAAFFTTVLAAPEAQVPFTAFASGPIHAAPVAHAVHAAPVAHHAVHHAAPVAHHAVHHAALLPTMLSTMPLLHTMLCTMLPPWSTMLPTMLLPTTLLCMPLSITPTMPPSTTAASLMLLSPPRSAPLPLRPSARPLRSPPRRSLMLSSATL